MDNKTIIENIIKIFIEYKSINLSKCYIERIFIRLLANINKLLNRKLLSNGCNMQETNIIFNSKYNIFIYNFMNNLDPKSKLNENLPGEYKQYLVDNINKYISFSLLFPKVSSLSILKKIHNKTFGDFNIKKIIHGNIFYLNPYLNIEYVKEIEIKSKQNVEQTVSKLYRCSKCRKNRTKYTRMQTRSSDEGYTLFINCIECGHKWMEHC